MFCQKCYCVQYKGPELINSTSGGVFFAFAKYVLEKKGCVFGAAYDSNLVLRHIATEKIDDLKRIQGSKYVESDFIGVFSDLKKRLDNGQLCLFCGTPCQIAAVRAFLKRDHQNLLLIDILCHGTPSRILFRKYIAWREKKWKTKILNFEFRNKRAAQWGEEQKALVMTENGEKIIPAICDPYFSAFQKGLIAQGKCYSCKFASPNRVGDITAADFWGVRRIFPDFPYAKGASCLLVNTERGELFFNKVVDSFIVCKSEFEIARQYNRHFNEPLAPNPIHEKIYAIINEEKSDFADALHLFPRKSYLWYIVQNSKNSVKRFVKKIFRIKK